MKTETRTTDTRARVTLPRSFANSAIIIEHVSETELRIRKARVIPEDEIRFREESPLVLSDRDRDRFLELLDNPPSPMPLCARSPRGTPRTADDRPIERTG